MLGPPLRAGPPAAGAAEVRIGFERGRPVALSGVTMTPAELVDSLATITRAHGGGTWTMRGDGAAGGTRTVHAPAALALPGLDGFVDRVLDPATGEVRLCVVDGRIEVEA